MLEAHLSLIKILYLEKISWSERQGMKYLGIKEVPWPDTFSKYEAMGSSPSPDVNSEYLSL